MAGRFSTQIVHHRLVSYAEWYVSKQGYRFGPGAERDINKMLGRSARRLRSEVRNLEDEQAEVVLRRAEASIRRLINRMLREREAIPGYASAHRGTVGEETLHLALKGICPLWPIC
jgi:hypothetical protein